MRYYLTVMLRLAKILILAAALLAPAFPQNAANPLVGRWDLAVARGTGTVPSWLGVVDKGGTLEVWYQPPTGNVYQLKDFKITGSHLTIAMSAAAANRPPMTWDLDAAGDKLTGVQKRGDATSAITGVRAPDMKRPAPRAWTDAQPLFNGKNLDGWQPIGDTAHNNWIVQDGLLVNTAHGANLMTTRKFDDFKVHFEVNCPDGGNSGFFLRGRYETQIEYEPLSDNPPERRIGSIYGRITPKDIPRVPGTWETFDITLVGRIVTIVRNGVITIDHQEIDGITGGALDVNEGEPGPFYIQGDHTGGLKFRNITFSEPKS
jgi:hypothetical protein